MSEIKLVGGAKKLGDEAIDFLKEIADLSVHYKCGDTVKNIYVKKRKGYFSVFLGRNRLFNKLVEKVPYLNKLWGAKGFEEYLKARAEKEGVELEIGAPKVVDRSWDGFVEYPILINGEVKGKFLRGGKQKRNEKAFYGRNESDRIFYFDGVIPGVNDNQPIRLRYENERFAYSDYNDPISGRPMGYIQNIGWQRTDAWKEIPFPNKPRERKLL